MLPCMQQPKHVEFTDLEGAHSLQCTLVSLLVLYPSKQQLPDLWPTAHIHEVSPWNPL